MTDSLSDSDLDSVRGVIDAATLRDIQFYEVSARRNEGELEEDQAGNVTIEVQQRFGEGDFGVRLSAQVVVPAGEIVASVAAEYDLTEGYQPSKRALAIFANEVAVMTVFPYLREAVATASAKVFGRPVHLPVIQRGQIGITLEDDD